MFAVVKCYQAEFERKFSIISVIQKSLQYWLPAQNVQVRMLTEALKNTTYVKLVIHWLKQWTGKHVPWKAQNKQLLSTSLPLYLHPPCPLTFPSPGHFTTAASCPLQTALLFWCLVPLIEVASHAGLQQLCDVCKRGKTGSEPHVHVSL